MPWNWKRPITLLLTLLTCSTVVAAPAKDLDERWLAFNPLSTASIDYTPWQHFLDTYVTRSGGQTYVGYRDVSTADKTALTSAIVGLSNLKISDYNRREQMAYWINLYNMEAVLLVLDHYPVDSIRDIGSGLLSSGPWDEPVLQVEGRELSLNDIEHRILRPIWNDPRIHTAVNCASMSCPNLQPHAFSGENLDQQMNEAFREFVNSPKGVSFLDSSPRLSKIFDWYGDDFGAEQETMLHFIARFMEDASRTSALAKARGGRFQPYDWSLNQKLD